MFFLLTFRYLQAVRLVCCVIYFRYDIICMSHSDIQFPQCKIIFYIIDILPWLAFICRNKSFQTSIINYWSEEKKNNYHMNPNNNKIMLQAVIIHTFLEIVFFNCTMFKRSGRFLISFKTQHCIATEPYRPPM
jgi:hypothetical protein